MRKLIILVALLIPGSVALAQTGSGNPASSNLAGTSTAAPVGHRQPHANQVPSEKNLSDPNTAINREDAALDRKIKSICRGC
jgi:hypothetical protein